MSKINFHKKPNFYLLLKPLVSSTAFYLEVSMAQVTPYIDLKNVQKKFDNLINCLDDSAVVFEKTLKDMRSRAPGKVADAVRGVYNIKKNEIMPSKEEKSAGTIKIKGENITSLKLIYEGRRLTPLHFGMTPKERPDKKKYKVTAKIKKGKKTVFTPENENGGVFLAPAKKGSSTILPWERHSEKSYDISPIKTMSLPQMIGPNPQTGEGGNTIVMNQINESLNELLDKRFNYHLKKHLDKVKG